MMKDQNSDYDYLGRWIKVTDELPGETNVMVITNGEFDYCHFSRGKFVTDAVTGGEAYEDELWRVTHWMYPPEINKDILTR